MTLAEKAGRDLSRAFFLALPDCQALANWLMDSKDVDRQLASVIGRIRGWSQARLSAGASLVL